MPNAHNYQEEKYIPNRPHPCSGWLLDKCDHENYRWIPLFCHGWKCPICRPRNLKTTTARLCLAYRAAAASGVTLKFVTLTYRNDVTRQQVRRSLQHLVQSFRRQGKVFEYARFPEYTKAGRIHLHLVVLAPFIYQLDLSEAWRIASQGSYIVDIRRIWSDKQLAAYVTKYVAKQPAGKITYSRNFPQFQDILDRKGQPKEHPGHHYTFFRPYQLDIQDFYAPELWTGEIVFAHGKCNCWACKGHSPPSVPTG